MAKGGCPSSRAYGNATQHQAGKGEQRPLRTICVGDSRRCPQANMRISQLNGNSTQRTRQSQFEALVVADERRGRSRLYEQKVGKGTGA